MHAPQCACARKRLRLVSMCNDCSRLEWRKMKESPVQAKIQQAAQGPTGAVANRRTLMVLSHAGCGQYVLPRLNGAGGVYMLSKKR